MPTTSDAPYLLSHCIKSTASVAIIVRVTAAAYGNARPAAELDSASANFITGYLQLKLDSLASAAMIVRVTAAAYGHARPAANSDSTHATQYRR